jgi:hypothetical protein
MVKFIHKEQRVDRRDHNKGERKKEGKKESSMNSCLQLMTNSTNSP